MALRLYSPAQIAAIAKTGEALARILERVRAGATPGARTDDLDALASALAREEGLDAAPQSPHASGVLGVNMNSQAANAPAGQRRLGPGDVVTLDLAVRGTDGLWADAATSICVGGEASALVDAARAVTGFLLSQLAPGVRWASLIAPLEACARGFGCRVAPWPVAHGIGIEPHERPYLSIPAREDLVLRAGMVLAIEPIVLAGEHGPGLETAADGQTLVTGDARPAAFEERTVAVVPGGSLELTRLRA